ncbi:BrnT family toxin [bacterium]|nr:BrnT family toxin [bacterium]
MIFEWDDKKNQSNIKKHGICFEDVCEIFKYPRLTIIDNRFDYKEKRYISIGTITKDIQVIIVYTERNKHIRIISARKANARERKKFNDHIKTTTG